MDKHAIAGVLEEIGTLLELRGEDPFRARAYYNAARALEGVEGDVAMLARTGELEKVKGFGRTTARVVRELVEAGVSSYHQELRRGTPAGLLELLGVPGLGARRVRALHVELGITSLEELERAAAEGRVAGVAGFGEKTQQKILEGIAFLRSVAGRRRQPEAWAAAEQAVDYLRAHPEVARVEVAGELRRWLEVADGVDLVASVVAGAERVIGAFFEMPGVAHGERVGEAGARVRLSDGLELRLRCAAPEAFVAAWVHGTGSEAHVAALVRRAVELGLRLDGSGLWRDGERVALGDEAELYAALGLAYVAPELREGLGEVEAAAVGGLPRLVTAGDLRGAFHCHTTYSDGRASVRELAEAALARGWRYLGIADHSQVAAYAGGLTPERLRRQHEEIDAWNAERGDELWLFKGVEADILPDGRLDYADLDEDVLASCDYVVGSVHSAFGQSEAEMTRRVLRALENPHLTFLGHPTGRLLLSRKGFELDMEAVIDAAAERGVGIEINANPWRLDMDWRLWRRAREKGVKTAINPDAHSVAELDHVRFGVAVARKGWLTPEDVVSAWDLERVRAYFERRKSR